MWPSEWLPIESESLRLLAECRGLRGQAWSYSTSHSQMLVRFCAPSSLAGIYLYCEGCQSIQFQGYWDEADPSTGIGFSKFPDAGCSSPQAASFWRNAETAATNFPLTYSVRICLNLRNTFAR